MRGRGGARGPDKVAVDHDVGLDDAFAGEDDVFGPEDGGAAGDFVAGFLEGRRASVSRFCVVVGGLDMDGLERADVRSQCILRARRVWEACRLGGGSSHSETTRQAVMPTTSREADACRLW